MALNKSQLLELRDQALMEKWYQLHNIERKRFDDVLKELAEKHFFMTEEHISRFIREAINNEWKPENPTE